MFIRAVLLTISSLLLTSVYAQEEAPMPTTPEEAEAKYARNIKKSRIKGVYIPKDHKEAILELKEMSPDKALGKFRTQSEDMVVRKLHFGLGRWIRYNWNFYEGSRLSEHLKKMGVSHPDDMSNFLMRLLHRDLNGNPANEKELIAKLSDDRKKKIGLNKKYSTIKTTQHQKETGGGKN